MQPTWSDAKGAYVALMPLASGGMGTVELAMREDGGFSRLVAIKRLHAHLRADESFLAMFVDEARLAGMIRHANVVSVSDVGVDERGPFFVMDYVEGSSLSKVLLHHARKDELLPIQICVRIAQQIADGLHAAHELTSPDGSPLELVHRDVSPQNVLVGFDGVVRLLDFGVAKALGQSSHTGLGILKGKVGYMSPEQLRYEHPDRRSDLFALGVLLHEMLCGIRLYVGESHLVAQQILGAPPPDPSEVRADVPVALIELAFALLAKDRNDRPGSAREVSRRLEAVLVDCVAEEGSLGLAEYMRQIFAAEIEASRSTLQLALKKRAAPLEQPVPVDDSATRIDPPAVSRSWYQRPAIRVAVATLAAGALAALALAAPGKTAAAPPNPLARRAPPPTSTPDESPAVTPSPSPTPPAARKTPPRGKPAENGASIPVWRWGGAK